LGQIGQAAPMWDELTQLYLTAAGIFLVGALLLPSALFAAGGMVGKPIYPPEWLNKMWHPALLILFLPLVLFLGDQIARRPSVAWFGLPPLHIFAVGLPVLWLVWLGRRGLPAGSPQRIWGIFGAGMVIGPAVILLVELVAVVIVILAVSAFLSTQPGLLEELTALLEHIQQYGEVPEEMLRQLTPFLLRPELIFLLFAFVAGFVPLVEEAIKPVGVLIYAGRIPTAVEGFVGGLLSGAGFALFENLLLSTIGGFWTTSVILRIGAGLLHIMATGLVGWALALAWQEKRYGRLVLSYLTAVLIHGLWNALALLSGAAALGIENEAALEQLSLASAAGLAGLAVLMFIILLASNRSLNLSRNLIIIDSEVKWIYGPKPFRVLVRQVKPRGRALL
jgi:RsiW-degrading membrane proteinase PrsW (M82 family)